MKLHEFKQYSDKWWAMRLAKPSSSNAKKLITGTGAISKSMADYAIELANDAYAGEALESWGGNAHTDRGTELEPEAVAYYQFMKDADVYQVGMFTDDKERYVSSPDGAVGDNGLLEVKCLSAKIHTKVLIYYKKNKKTPPDYVPQLQSQLHIAEKEWDDILFYHDKLPSLIIRNYPDSKFATALSGQLVNVCAERDSVIETLRGFK